VTSNPDIAAAFAAAQFHICCNFQCISDAGSKLGQTGSAAEDRIAANRGTRSGKKNSVRKEPFMRPFIRGYVAYD
jgi:hypothetical protein